MTDKSWMDINPRKLLPQLGLGPHKAYGQNFLVRPAELDRVADAAELSPSDVVLEIGTGIARLTGRLAERAGHVITVEIDRGLHSVAKTHLEGFGNVTLLCCDFLASKHLINPEVTAACVACGGELRVVSNLPYSISSPAVVNMLEWPELRVVDMHLMVQKEVAQRLAAAAGAEAYGPLTVYTQYWATVKRLFNMPRGAFWPKPDVTSSLVRIVRSEERQRCANYAAFCATVHRLFIGRRKTLTRSLRDGWGRDVARRVPEELGMDPKIRPGMLAVADFEAIAEAAGPPTK
jgi:16S rRNA (adenine1518-N6/adenine1519-N6)-dimethyltransferase